MNYKIFIILIFFIFSGCKLETVNKKVNYDNNIYVNKGFTLIYSDELIKDKITKKKIDEIGRAHTCTPVTRHQLVCRLLLNKK